MASILVLIFTNWLAVAVFAISLTLLGIILFTPAGRKLQKDKRIFKYVLILLGVMILLSLLEML